MTPKKKFNDPVLGEFFCYESKSVQEDWTPVNFLDLPLEYSIRGCRERPHFHSADLIREITGKPIKIESAIRKYLSDSSFAFLEHALTFELEHLSFDDVEQSSRYVATCVSEFDEYSPVFPSIPSSGNGFWDLKFRLLNFEVVEYIQDEAEYF